LIDRTISGSAIATSELLQTAIQGAFTNGTSPTSGQNFTGINPSEVTTGQNLLLALALSISPLLQPVAVSCVTMSSKAQKIIQRASVLMTHHPIFPAIASKFHYSSNGSRNVQLESRLFRDSHYYVININPL
jgi:hypothetical protein